MSSIRLWCCAVFLMAVSYIQAKEPNLAGEEFVFELNEGNEICFYASFKLDFSISYRGYPNISNKSIIHIMSTEVRLPNNTEVTTSGDCGQNVTTLSLVWEEDDKTYNSSFVFTLLNGTWFASSISFTFNLTKFSNPVYTGVQTYVADGPNLFARDFNRNEFFYCEKCKTFSFMNCSDDSVAMGTCVEPCSTDNKTASKCSTLDMMRSVIYPGDIVKNSASRKLCIEDYIALQELIVPIVVGGILALLLLLISVAYIIAYIRRRKKEGNYERLSGNHT